jgi:hypothetical protein
VITQFHVQNYKALRDITLPLTPIHVLIGPNDSGKTSILEAIAALCRSAEYPLDKIFPGTSNLPDLLWDTLGDDTVSLGAQIVDDAITGEYRIRCTVAAGAAGPRLAEEVWIPNGQQPISFPPAGVITNLLISRVEGRGGMDRTLAKQLYDALSGVVLFRWNPRLLKLPVVLDAAHRLSMDSSGFGLAQCLDDLLGLDRERFRKLETKFCEIFPEMKSVQLRSVNAYQWPQLNVAEDLPRAASVTGKGIYFELINGRSIPAAQASDGSMLVLAYLTLLHLPDPPRVILVEEPENGIHPRRLGEVLNILRQLIASQKRTQIIMTTHSPYLLDLFKPEEVTLCRKEPGLSVSVHPLGLIPDIKKQLGVFNLGEIWTAEGDEALAKARADGKQ